jgi:mannonate dehydratase
MFVSGKMHVILKMVRDYNEAIVRFAKQLGLEGIQIGSCNYLGETYYEYEKLLAVKNRLAEQGLKLEAIENVPISQSYKIMYGIAGRDEQIDNYIKTIKNIGKVGIPILGFNFMPTMVWRTSDETPGRGGALVTSFDADLVPEGNKHQYMEKYLEMKLDAATMWENYEYFIKAVIPTAEAAGVKLALHPDDPPIDEVDGVARIFTSPSDFKRGMAIADSNACGLDLCLGCCSEMKDGADRVLEMIDSFGPLGKIFYVHFRDVQGNVPKFQECFIDEGNFNPAEVLLRLKKVGFKGHLIDDHVPRMFNDSGYNFTSRAYAIGYIKGLIKMAEHYETAKKG